MSVLHAMDVAQPPSPGKVVDRKWYERNQHVFPASRWEPFDPNKDYGSYTIRGKPKRDN